jgi:hypothetical protein
MNTLQQLIAAACAAVLTATVAWAAEPAKQLVIYDNVPTEVAPPPAALQADGDLWVTLGDLTRATKFTLKPQGVCRAELCFPLPKNRKTAFLRPLRKTTWFNLSEFARLVRQPAARDAETATWYFGPRQEEQNQFIGSLTAPDFTLPDVNGKAHSLRDFRGKKVLLLTWASW